MQRPNELIAALIRASRAIYRRAIAAQVAGETGEYLWAAWRKPVSGLLLSAWSIGSAKIVKATPLKDFDDEAADIPDFPVEPSGRYAVPWPEQGPQQVAQLFRGRIPTSRRLWETLAERSRQYADAMAHHEATHALPEMMHRSPDFAALAQGQIPPGILRPSDAFFATGVPVEKAAALRNLIADNLAGVATGTRGKVKAMGLGEFILTAQQDLGLRLTDARLETVLRTNTASAQTEGERDTLKNPTVRNFVPLVMHSATKDARTRPEHLAFDGYIGTIDEFERQGVTVPLGYNCRCAQIPVPISRAIDNGWVNPDGSLNQDAISKHNGARQALIDSGQIPDPGFIK